MGRLWDKSEVGCALRRIVWVPVVAVQCWLAYPLVFDRLQSAFWWPVIATAVYSLWSVLFRSQRTEEAVPRLAWALIWIGGCLLPSGLFIDAAWVGCVGLWLSLCCLLLTRKIPGAEHPLPLTFGLPIVLLAGIPEALGARFWNALVRVLSLDGVVLAAADGNAAWLEQTRVTTGSEFVDLAELLNSAFGWMLPVSVTLVWLTLVGTSLLYAVATLGLVLVSSFCVYVLGLRFLVQSMAAGGFFYESPWLATTSLLAAYAAIMRLADLFVFALAAPVFGDGDDGAVVLAPGPLHVLWNYCVSGVGTIRPRDIDWRCDDGELIPMLPALRQFLSDWFGSRLLFYLPASMPLLLLSGWCLYSCESSAQTRDQAVLLMQQRYETGGADSARHDGNLLRCLTVLKPHDTDQRLQLLDWLYRNQFTDECGQHLELLLPEAGGGSAAARLWLVQNSLQPEPLRVLTDADRIDQLRRATEENSNLADAFGLLGQLYLDQNEGLLAVRNLEQASRMASRWTLSLLRAYRSLGMVPENPDVFQRCRTELQARQESAAFNEELLLELVHFDLLLGDGDAALRAVTAARKRHDTPQLRDAEAGVRLSLLQGVLNDVALLQPARVAEQLQTLLNLSPHRKETLYLLMDLYVRAGWRPDDAVKDLVVRYWDARPGEPAGSAVDRDLHLRAGAFMRELEGDSAGAVGMLGELTVQTHRDRLLLVHALMACGEEARAQEFVKRRTLNVLGQADISVLEQQVELGCAALLFDEALGWLRQWTAGTGRSLPGLIALVRLQQLDFVLGYPGMFSGKLPGWNPDVETIGEEVLLAMISECLSHPRTRLVAIDRVVSLMGASKEWRTRANAIALAIRADGDAVEEVLFLTGTRLLERGDAVAAIDWLEAGARVSATPNPWMLNNLANALLQQGPSDRLNEAMHLVDRALALRVDEPMFLRTRAEINLKLQNYSAAARDIEESLALDPGNAVAMQLKSRLNRDRSLLR